MLKDKILLTYEAYGHAIHLNNKAFNRLMSMVMGYETESFSNLC